MSELLQIVRGIRAANTQAAMVESAARLGDLGLDAYRVEVTPARDGCQRIVITPPNGEAFAGFIRTARAPRSRCGHCYKRWSVGSCDFPTGGKCKRCKGSGKTRGGKECHPCAGTTYQLCNLKLCETCRLHNEPDEDICPRHRVAAGYPALVIAEECMWTYATVFSVIDRRCLHNQCPSIIGPEDMILAFPRRARAMCQTCGLEYKKIAVQI